MEIFAVKINNSIDNTQFQKLVKLISVEKQKRISLFRNYKDAQRSVISELLIRYVISIKKGLKNNNISFYLNEFGTIKGLCHIPRFVYRHDSIFIS